MRHKTVRDLFLFAIDSWHFDINPESRCQTTFNWAEQDLVGKMPVCNLCWLVYRCWQVAGVVCFTGQVFLTYQRGKYGGLTAVYLNFLQFVLFSDVKGQVLPFCKLAQCLCLAALPWVRRLMCALLLSTWYRGRRSFWNRLLVMMENWKWANVSLRRGAVFKSMNFNGFQYMTPANVYCVCLTIVVFFFLM